MEEIKERIVRINSALLIRGMDEVEIMNFWEECLEEAKIINNNNQ
jgi:hypothetical protein